MLNRNTSCLDCFEKIKLFPRNSSVRSAESESIRKQIVDATYHAETLSTSVDLPLSKASKSVLAQAEKERVRLGVANLGTEHVLLGLLQQESLAAQVLRERGIKVESVREQFENPVPSGPSPEEKDDRL